MDKPLTPITPADRAALDASYEACTAPWPRVATGCRICGEGLEEILTLGDHYLPEFPNSAGTRSFPAVPLELTRCPSLSCGLVQLRHTTPPSWLYRQYWYRSGVNEAMRLELADVVRSALARVSLPKTALVGDIGANDGTLLACYRDHQVAVSRVAWEPARNLYQACRPHAEILFPEFFAPRASDWHTTKLHVLTSVAMFYDLDDPHQFVSDAAQVLHPDGVWVIQQAYLPAMLECLGFDNVCHEHLEYYHLQPLEKLLAEHGLEVFEVEHRAINAGSFRAYVRHAGKGRLHSSVLGMRYAELALDLHHAGGWSRWATAVSRLQNRIIATVAGAADKGHVVDLLGASTKGHTLLQACGLDARVIRQAWERSPEKVGRYYGATGIPIVSEAEGRGKGLGIVPCPPAPDLLLATAWQFRAGLIEREFDYLQAGGKICFPMPNCEVVGG